MNDEVQLLKEEITNIKKIMVRQEKIIRDLSARSKRNSGEIQRHTTDIITLKSKMQIR